MPHMPHMHTQDNQYFCGKAKAHMPHMLPHLPHTLHLCHDGLTEQFQVRPAGLVFALLQYAFDGLGQMQLLMPVAHVAVYDLLVETISGIAIPALLSITLQVTLVVMHLVINVILIYKARRNTGFTKAIIQHKC